jgi:hypothetical protein
VEDRIFDPIKKIRQVKQQFVVEANWPQTEGFELGDAAFELTRDVSRR